MGRYQNFHGVPYQVYCVYTVQVRQPVAMDVGEVEKKGLCIDSRAQDAHAVGK